MKKLDILDKLKKLNNIKVTMPKKSSKKKQDFNFFEPYIGKHEQQRNHFIYISAAAAAIVVIFISTFVWNLVQIKNTEKEVDNLKNIIESPATKAKLNEIDKLNKKYNILNKYYGQAYIITGAIDNKSIITSSSIQEIFSQIPKTVSFKSFNFTVGEKGTGGNVDIQGIAENRTSIAELEYNLKLVDSIKEVQVSNITEVNNVVESNLNVNLTNNSSYTFSIKCTLKDVDQDEAK